MNKYLELARKLAIKNKHNKRCAFGAVGLRSDGATVYSTNIRNCGRDINCHAETRLSRKLDVGSIVYVARIHKQTHNLTLARPCSGCQQKMKSKGVKRVYYTINDNEFGEINF